MKTQYIAFAALTSIFASLPVQAGTPCNELLEGNSYVCNFKYDNGYEYSSPMYVTLPAGYGDFDIEVPAEGTTHQCICQAKGSFKKPAFRESADFLCNDDGNWGEAMVGKATKKGIKKGQYQQVRGLGAAVFECELDDGIDVSGAREPVTVHPAKR
jgi:hypothetical protein